MILIKQIPDFSHLDNCLITPVTKFSRELFIFTLRISIEIYHFNLFIVHF